MITQEQVHELFYYDPETGILTFKYSNGKAKAGAMVGTLLTNGYLRTYIDKKSHYIHRIVFLYCHGNMPNQIDHINKVKTDNRICNLRECNKSQNEGNTEKRSNNTSGYKGVFSHHGKWMVRVAGTYIGLFDTPLDAALAYDKAAIEHYGEFASTNFPAWLRQC